MSNYTNNELTKLLIVKFIILNLLCTKISKEFEMISLLHKLKNQ